MLDVKGTRIISKPVGQSGASVGRESFLTPLGTYSRETVSRVTAVSGRYFGTAGGRLFEQERWESGLEETVRVSGEIQTIGGEGWALPISTQGALHLVHVEHQKVTKSIDLARPLSCGAILLSSTEFLCCDESGLLFSVDSKGNQEEILELPSAACRLLRTDDHLVVGCVDRLELRDPSNFSLRAQLISDSPIVAVQQEYERPTYLFVAFVDGRHGEVRLPRRKKWPKAALELQLDRVSNPLSGPLIEAFSTGNHWHLISDRGSIATVRRKDQLHQSTVECHGALQLADSWRAVGQRDGQLVDLRELIWPDNDPKASTPDDSFQLHPPFAIHPWKRSMVCCAGSRLLTLVEFSSRQVENYAELPGGIHDVCWDSEDEGWLCLLARLPRAPVKLEDSDFIGVPESQHEELSDAILDMSGEDPLTIEEYQAHGPRLILQRCDSELDEDSQEVFNIRVPEDRRDQYLDPHSRSAWVLWDQVARRYDLEGELILELKSAREIVRSCADHRVFVAARGGNRMPTDLWFHDLESGEEWAIDLGMQSCTQLVIDLRGRLLVTTTENCYILSSTGRSLVDPLPLEMCKIELIFLDPHSDEIWTVGRDWIERLDSEFRPIGFGRVAHRRESRDLAFSPDGVVVSCGPNPRLSVLRSITLKDCGAELIDRSSLSEPHWLRVALHERVDDRFPMEEAPLHGAHRAVDKKIREGKKLQYRGEAAAAQGVATWERVYWQAKTRGLQDSPLRSYRGSGSLPIPDSVEGKALEELRYSWTGAPLAFEDYWSRYGRSREPVADQDQGPNQQRKKAPVERETRVPLSAKTAPQTIDRLREMIEKPIRSLGIWGLDPRLPAPHNHWNIADRVTIRQDSWHDSRAALAVNSVNSVMISSFDDVQPEEFMELGIEHLYFRGDKADLRTLRGTQGLRSLYVNAPEIQDLGAIAEIPDLQTLQLPGLLQPEQLLDVIPATLIAFTSPMKIGKTWRALLGRLERVEHLRLGGVPSSEILACEVCPHLKTLDLRSHRVSRDISLPQLPKLEGLALRLGVKMGKLLETADQIDPTYLDIRESSGRDFSLLERWRNLKTVEAGDISFRFLAEWLRYLVSLESLSCDLADLRDLPILPKLKELRFGYSHMNKHLEHLLEFPELESIYLSGSENMRYRPKSGILIYEPV